MNLNEDFGIRTSPCPVLLDHYKELEKKIKRIELEKEILKKATALLMSDSINNLK
ncbi:hypothetical protein TUM4438_46840 [Shewanella sairae]|uniref:Transposase n=1 Tax=Shewanella sairae TaxID=190310 RepID=A0ABQ4NTQ3_9GAMM|nr:hypothetical protein TUM4438_46840 [Shewanella sairae]